MEEEVVSRYIRNIEPEGIKLQKFEILERLLESRGTQLQKKLEINTHRNCPNEEFLYDIKVQFFPYVHTFTRNFCIVSNTRFFIYEKFKCNQKSVGNAKKTRNIQ